ncbi:hypothetical protein D3C79_949240 [compost metagenome]
MVTVVSLSSTEFALLVVEQTLRLAVQPVTVQVERFPELVKIQIATFLQRQHIELEAIFGQATEYAPVVLASQHHQGETGELAGAVVDIEAEQVVFQNQLRNLA